MTAAHVVTGAQMVRMRYPDKKLQPARIDARFVGGGHRRQVAKWRGRVYGAGVGWQFGWRVGHVNSGQSRR